MNQGDGMGREGKGSFGLSTHPQPTTQTTATKTGPPCWEIKSMDARRGDKEESTVIARWDVTCVFMLCCKSALLPVPILRVCLFLPPYHHHQIHLLQHEGALYLQVRIIKLHKWNKYTFISLFSLSVFHTFIKAFRFMYCIIIYQPLTCNSNINIRVTILYKYNNIPLYIYWNTLQNTSMVKEEDNVMYQKYSTIQ